MAEDKDVIEELAASGMTAEEMAQAWEQYVRDEVNAYLDTFLPEAVNGNVGVVYKRPIKEIDVKTGEPVFEENKAVAVDIHLVFEFPKAIEFFDTKPSE